MIEASFRGSAEVGWGGSRLPFARLVATEDTLTLSSLTLGTYSFAPSDVVAIEPHGSISTLASAIRIDHNRKDYPKRMIFWCKWGRRSAILEEIRRIGFHPSGQPIGPWGSPLRWSAVLIAVGLWAGLFLLDASGWLSLRGFFSFLALLLVFCAATATRGSASFQRFVLRDGHQLSEIVSFLTDLQIISAILLLMLGFALFGQWKGSIRWG